MSTDPSGLRDWLHAVWYGRRPERWLLWPVAQLWRLVAAVRRLAYVSGIARVHEVCRPVVVVGNITAGGTGKTPLVIWLAGQLRDAGFEPGIVSRGYGGRQRRAQRVQADSDPRETGDESVLLARRCACPVAVGADRVAAARLLEADADVIISDDGLQHLALARSLEIAVIDGARGLGNGLCLPAGPLREPASRLRTVDVVVENVTAGGVVRHGGLAMTLVASDAVGVATGERRPLEAFRGQAVHALAGIGNPDRFFRQLEGFGLRLIAHPLADHKRLAPRDIEFPDGLAVLMTEKDAVKCLGFASARHWFVPVDAEFAAADAAALRRAVLGVVP
ncbi:MAG TPA: tetraacyldisaccharide 4'-kinase [Gammaproteobacteria bacterium]|nr:tetraacyldisaccharide 4'-kinase [Gammaproteobacteria bacterium]